MDYFSKQLQHAMAQLQQIQKQHANQQQFGQQSRERCNKPGGSLGVCPPMSLPLPLPLPSSSVAGGASFSDRPTPTKAQLTMPPRINHHKGGPGLVISVYFGMVTLCLK